MADRGTAFTCYENPKRVTSIGHVRFLRSDAILKFL